MEADEKPIETIEKKKPNIQLIVTSALSILFLGFGVFFYLWKEEEHSGRVNAEKKLEQTLVAKKIVEGNLKESLQKNEEMTAQMKELESQISEAEERVGALEEEKLSLSDQREKDQARIQELEENLQAEQKDKEMLARDLEQLKTEYSEVEKKLADLEKEEKEAVELGKITVTPPKGPSEQTVTAQVTEVQPEPSTAKSGRILVVNDEFNFVVVSFGKNDGLKGGEVLSIYRDGQLLGKVQVEKLYDAISAATILDGKTALYREGDVVRL